MTRTARSSNPKALSKDRSESKSGLDKSLRKNGGGQHNWGNINDEYNLENAALEDEGYDAISDNEKAPEVPAKPAVNRSVSEEEVAIAKEFRKHALKGDVDLAAIARTSAAVSTSPPRTSLTNGSHSA